MQQVLRIEGMHCAGCADRVTRALAALAERVTVTLDPPQALLQVASPLPLQAVQVTLRKVGDYRAAAVE